jgi:hypothetical protein
MDEGGQIVTPTIILGVDLSMFHSQMLIRLQLQLSSATYQKV